jgi:hypothetical protein
MVWRNFQLKYSILNAATMPNITLFSAISCPMQLLYTEYIRIWIWHKHGIKLFLVLFFDYKSNTYLFSSRIAWQIHWPTTNNTVKWNYIYIWMVKWVEDRSLPSDICYLHLMWAIDDSGSDEVFKACKPAGSRQGSGSAAAEAACTAPNPSLPWLHICTMQHIVRHHQQYSSCIS